MMSSQTEAAPKEYRTKIASKSASGEITCVVRADPPYNTGLRSAGRLNGVFGQSPTRVSLWSAEILEIRPAGLEVNIWADGEANHVANLKYVARRLAGASNTDTLDGTQLLQHLQELRTDLLSDTIEHMNLYLDQVIRGFELSGPESMESEPDVASHAMNNIGRTLLAVGAIRSVFGFSDDRLQQVEGRCNGVVGVVSARLQAAHLIADASENKSQRRFENFFAIIAFTLAVASVLTSLWPVLVATDTFGPRTTLLVIAAASVLTIAGILASYAWISSIRKRNDL